MTQWVPLNSELEDFKLEFHRYARPRYAYNRNTQNELSRFALRKVMNMKYENVYFCSLFANFYF